MSTKTSCASVTSITEWRGNVAEHAENGVGWSRVVRGHSRIEQGRAWSGRPWRGSTADSGCHKNRLER